jgi:taurine transport system permease protein
VRAFDLLGLVGITSNPDLFVPEIQKVANQFVNLAFGGGYRGESLWFHLGWSMLRLGIGFALAVLIGVPLGLFMGTSKTVAAIFDPLIEFYRSLPPLGYYTLLIVWLGIGELPKITLLFLAALAPIVINTRTGVRGVRETWREQAQCLGASRSYVFWHVMIPASTPHIFAGLKLSLGFAYTTLVAAELVAATKGIGWMVLDASKFLRVDVVFVGVIVMGVTAIFLDRLLRWLEDRLVPWRGKE